MCADIKQELNEPLPGEETIGKPRLDTLISTFPGLIYRCLNDASWATEFVSAGVYDLTEHRPEEFFGRNAIFYPSLIHPNDHDRVFAEVHSAVKDKRAFQMSYRIVTASGKEKWVLEQGNALYDAHDRLVALQGYVVDITQQKNLEVALREKAALLDRAHDAIVVSRLDGRITYWNKGAERIFGWSADEAIGKNMIDLAILDPAKRRAAVQVAVQQGDWRGEIRKRQKSGQTILVEAHYTLVKDENGQPQSIFAIETDITQRKAAESQIESLTFYDPLTGLPNRRLLRDRLKHALEAAERNSHNGGILFIDLDNFKGINDALGHDKGDSLLKQVAQRLENLLRKSNTIARFGGDEFVVLIEDLDPDIYMASRQAELVAEKILASFKAPFRLDGNEYHTTPSVGIVVFGETASNVDELLQRADLAMYRAKAAGRNTIRFFDPVMQANISERLLLESDFRIGLEEKQFSLFYQPQCDAAYQVKGVEALVRWRRNGTGLVSPTVFVPMAEETGLIVQLGEWILESACRQLVSWAAIPEKSHLTIAVNVSVKQFHYPDFIEQLLATVRDTGADPRKLKVELTESLLVESMEEAIEKMTILKNNGIALSLDDFGTGYSSLSYLKRLPLDQIKIDRSFVKDLLTDVSDAAIAQAIVALGKSLRLEVIAEGVETEEQRALLEQQGCHLYQGYLFGRPAPAETI